MFFNYFDIVVAWIYSITFVTERVFREILEWNRLRLFKDLYGMVNRWPYLIARNKRFVCNAILFFANQTCPTSFTTARTRIVHFRNSVELCLKRNYLNVLKTTILFFNSTVILTLNKTHCKILLFLPLPNLYPEKYFRYYFFSNEYHFLLLNIAANFVYTSTFAKRTK